MLDGFHFLQPYWLISLVIPLWLYFKGNTALALPELIPASRIRYPALGLLHSERDNDTSVVSVSRNDYSLLLFLTLLILSLAQPVRPGPVLPVAHQPQAVDVILVVNTGVSMVLRDYVVDGEQIDRMEMTRRLLKRLVDKFSGDRLALVVLGRPPSLWLPLTADRRVMQDAVSRLRATLGGRSSDLGETLALVKKQFARGEESDRNRRIVLLVNDGYSQLGAMAPEIALQPLIDDGFTLHTLAIGSARMPEFSLGRGTLIYQAADLRLMRELAAVGGGEMLHAQDLSIINPLLRQFSPEQQHKITVEPFTLVIGLYHYPLTLALMLLLYRLLRGSSGINARRNGA